MPGDAHNQLVALGEKWLKRQGFAVVVSELVTGGTREQADVLGFRSSCSVLIEAKASRADFLADARKPHRLQGGLGVYRFYLTLPGVIEVADLPARWGLLYAEGRGVRDVVRPTGNGWPSFGSNFGDWHAFQHEVDADAERGVLFSIARRRSLPRSDEKYEKQLQDEIRKAASLARRNDELAERVRTLERELYLSKVDRAESAAELATAIRRKIA
ncbi:hypothetical protein [Paraburkholderia sp. A3RO-2L]|uniref:hypothetical protein n=1 Tax=Paraburkholderia sp. A3RO-2L TaxID=3028376 RepID=UPI003DA7C9FA